MPPPSSVLIGQLDWTARRGSDETEEKGTLELSDNTAEKTEHGLDNIELSVSGDANGAQAELRAAIDDRTRERCEERAMNEESWRLPTRAGNIISSAISDDAVGPDAASTNSAVFDETEVVGHLEPTQRSDDDSSAELHHIEPDAHDVRAHDGQSDSSVGSTCTSPVAECQSAEANSCRLEPTGTDSDVKTLELISHKESPTAEAGAEDGDRCMPTAEEQHQQHDEEALNGDADGDEKVTPEVESVEMVQGSVSRVRLVIVRPT